MDINPELWSRLLDQRDVANHCPHTDFITSRFSREYFITVATLHKGAASVFDTRPVKGEISQRSSPGQERTRPHVKLSIP